MADRVMSGYSRTNRIRLPEEKILVDKTSVLGASVFATLLKANRTGDFSNVGNALTIYEAVTEVSSENGGSVDKFVASEETVTIVTDANGTEHKLKDAAMVTAYTDKGMTITRTETVKTWSDGTVTKE
tara:strand:+ start:2141 stop:2524 length:384 start_codon:yes stop_codon:yes gene_type:complete